VPLLGLYWRRGLRLPEEDVMTNPVVVGVDGTGRSLKALMWAAHRASLHEVPLRVVHALPRYEGDIPLFPPGRFEQAQEAGHEILAEAVALVREAYTDMDIAIEMPMGTPARVLVAESANAHVVVIGAKGEDIGNLLLGSTALQLVGHAACPVVVVNHVTTGHRLVVVGTDGSADSTEALAFGFGAASLRDARLQVISALGLPQGWPRHLLRPVPEDNEEVSKRRQEVENQIAPFREQYPEVEVEVDVHRVGPLPALASASHRADLLVVGSRGRGGFHGLAVGSTTHKLLHWAGCPMAVVHRQ
jgi:nucleotide-binding universal stress UspA family protein